MYTATYDPSVFVYYFTTCLDNCNDRGTCRFGICKCDSGYYGTKCQYATCPNTLCYYDIDTIDPSECIQCSGHGTCTEGVCACDEGYIGADCSMVDCKYNCSSTPSQVYGYCVHTYPVSQCVCDENLKRGGDYCEKLFCLNNCAGNGECLEDGSCVCNNLYSGKDCSVFVYPADSAVSFSTAWLVLLIIINFVM